MGWSERYYLGTTLLVVLVYFVYSRFAVGFYSHDEIGHFHNMQHFWLDPTAILSIWGKPGWKIFYAIPSLFGSQFLLIVNCIVTALTAYIASLVAKQYGIKDRIAVLLLCAFMPMLYQISFRFYAEPLVGFFLILSIYFYKKERFILAALCASYLFPIRHENALYAICMGVLFLRDRRFIPFLFLAASPILLNIVGWIAKGDPLYLLNEVIGGPADYNWYEPGFFHLWKVFFPITGPALAYLSILGIFGFGISSLGAMKYLKKYELLFIAFVPVFILHCLTCEPLFTPIKLTGNWKVMTPFASILAIFAGLGLKFLKLKGSRYKWYAMSVAIFITLFSFYLLSYKHNHFAFLTERDYIPSIALSLIALLLIFHKNIGIPSKYLGFSAGSLALIYTIYIEQPFPLNTEDKAVKDTAEWFGQNLNSNDNIIYVRHPAFLYFMKTSARDRREQFQGIASLESLNTLPRDSKVIWESHYTERYSKVGIDFFQNNQDYEKLHEIFTEDQRFYIAVFNKL